MTYERAVRTVGKGAVTTPAIGGPATTAQVGDAIAQAL